MRKWTAGPWSAHLKDAPGDMAIEARTRIHNNPIWIARVYGPGVLGRRDEEREGNARLIAAAPELAEACLAALAHFGPGGTDAPLEAKLRDVLRKAGALDNDPAYSEYVADKIGGALD